MKRRGMTLGLAFALAGCGEWVHYEEEPVDPPQIATPGDVDESLRDTYAELTRLDHLIFEGLLAQYVIDDGEGFTFVDYAGLAARPESLALLDQYLAILDLVDPNALADAAERQAYWYNAYNAAVLRGVLASWEGDPEWSVSNGGFAFFDFEIWSFGGTVLSLNQVEQGVIRGDFTHASTSDLDDDAKAVIEALHVANWEGAAPDPRLHVALNCASYSCPNLAASAPYAFRGAVLEEQLAALSRAFLANPIKGAGPNGISTLFLWYAPDWSNGYDGPAGFIEAWREGGLDGVDTSRYLTYDWTLNVIPAE